MIYTVTLNPSLDREFTVPELATDEVLRASETRTDYGGKGLNVARMLAALGAPCVALGFVGGYTGQALCAGVNELGIATDFTPISGETRSNISIVTSNHGRHIKVNEPGPPISESEQAALRARVAQLAQPGDWWVLAGILPPGVPHAYYADLVRDIQRAGGYAVLDTSGPPLQAACSAMPFLVKPNAREAGELAGKRIMTPHDALAAAPAFAGIVHLVISLGSLGAVLIHEGQAWLATLPAIAERNPIGAGDSMVAGLIWGLQHGDAQTALRWGVACGAATASRDGTAVGSYGQVVELLEQVRIEPISSP